MKLFIVSVLAAVASAKPSGIAAPLIYSSPVALAAPLAVSAPVSTQYHSQDELGQYSYGYSNAFSAKAESRAANGLTVGGYTYVDPEGKLQTVEYSSDVNGFRVAASNLPVPPAVPAAPALPVPVPVQDTPEVVEARAKHLEALEAAKVRNAEVAAAIPAFTTVVQSVSPVVGVAPAPLVAAPLLPAAAAPIIAVKSAAAPTEENQPQPPAPSSEAPTTPAPVEVPSTVAPSSEAPSENSPQATPAGVSILSAPALAVRSLIAPTLPVGVVAAPSRYSINSLYPYGFSSIVAQPALTTYTAQFLAPVPGQVIQNNESWTPAKNSEQSSE